MAIPHRRQGHRGQDRSQAQSACDPAGPASDRSGAEKSPAGIARRRRLVPAKKTRQSKIWSPVPSERKKALGARLFGNGIRFSGGRSALPQFLGGDESDADQFAPAP